MLTYKQSELTLAEACLAGSLGEVNSMIGQVECIMWFFKCPEAIIVVLILAPVQFYTFQVLCSPVLNCSIFFETSHADSECLLLLFFKFYRVENSYCC